MIKHGPVDLFVMAAGHPKFDGSVLAELERLSDAGTIRVLDAMVLLKNEDGSAVRVELKDLPMEQSASVSFIPAEARGLFDAEDAAALTAGMVPGSAVFALAIEHLWAISLVNALYDAGVEVAFHSRVPAPVVDEAFASLEAGA
jgi:hypothetical protein